MMEEETRGLIHIQRLDNVPELIHHIQSLLPLKEAARTSVLSKSWSHAWSTIPTLRFQEAVILYKEKPQKMFQKLINQTLQRYLRKNIPIESFNLKINIDSPKRDDLVKKSIRRVTCKSCVKELSLTIRVKIPSFTLPGEILFGENLGIVSVRRHGFKINHLWMSRNHVIKCLSLRVLELINVNISEETLNNLLSTCSLLEKINIFCAGVETIKVRNLHYLRELKITSQEIDSLELVDVPSLSLFFYDWLSLIGNMRLLPLKMDSLGSVKELFFGGVVIYGAFLNIIKSELPFLESLTLHTVLIIGTNLVIASNSLTRFTLCRQEFKISINFFTPKLLFLCYDGNAIPDLVFPSIAPEKIKLRLRLGNSIDHWSLLMREVLNQTSKFDVEILCMSSRLLLPHNVNLDDFRNKLQFPATNVEQVSFSKCSYEHFCRDSQLIDIFLLICHPTYVKVYRDKAFKNKDLFHELMVQKMNTKLSTGFWPGLKDVEVKKPRNGNRETSETFWKIFRGDDSNVDDRDYVEFKLDWYSP